jgi:4-hydroxy-4-methyl-2-oxoglutarate aldolase
MMDALLQSAIGLSTATAHEAGGKSGALPSIIKPLDKGMRVCGPAFTVKCPAGDNLVLHHALYAASAGDVLVVDCGDGNEFGYWGEVLSVAGQARSLGGLVITGGVRDAQRLTELGLPVFCSRICIRGTGKNPRGAGSWGESLTIGDVVVKAGDVVIGDQDGVMVIPSERAEQIIRASRARDAAEHSIFARLRAGETTVDIYGLPPIEVKT